MPAATSQSRNLNDARSDATRALLIDSTIASLIELGFAKTTGVAVCRRAQLTRGALNHHYPDFADLLVDSLQTLYGQLLDVTVATRHGPMEQFVLESHRRVTEPGFKAVIELWLASRNDAEFGKRLAQAIEQGSALFTPEMVLSGLRGKRTPKRTEAIYRTIGEALIGIGLGRAIGNQPLAHESMVIQMLRELAQQHDKTV